jgi:hypothetical protein
LVGHSSFSIRCGRLYAGFVETEGTSSLESYTTDVLLKVGLESTVFLFSKSAVPKIFVGANSKVGAVRVSSTKDCVRDALAPTRDALSACSIVMSRCLGTVAEVAIRLASCCTTSV